MHMVPPEFERAVAAIRADCYGLPIGVSSFSVGMKVVDFAPVRFARGPMGTVNASFRLALTTKSDEELWRLFLTHGEENCANDFWTEVRSRQEAGTLNRASPFWATGTPPINRLTQRVKPKGKLIELTPEEWFSRQRGLIAKLFRRRKNIL